MLNTKGVIFDFNGTLFLDNPKHVLAWSKISQDIRKCGVSEEELREHMNGVPNNKIVEYLYGGNCSKEDNDKYSALKEEYYREFCKEDKEGFISDICSAISEGKYSFRYEHPEEYWKKEGNKEKEIFANYYSLVAFRDIPKLDFLKKNLPEVYESCEKIKRQLQGEDD